MKFRYMSDLHLEFEPLPILPSNEDGETIMLLAGDICLCNNQKHKQILTEFLSNARDRFHRVLMIAGNHEFYHNRIDKTLRTLKGIEGEFANFRFLDNDIYEEDDFCVVGSTLWTDMDHGDQLVMFDAKNTIEDYKRITYNTKGVFRKLQPQDTFVMHLNHKKFINEVVMQKKAEGKKVVVMTHHAPTYKSICARYVSDNLTGVYASDVSDIMLDHEPDVWVHGHVHCSNDYMVGETRVLANPRGYSSGVYQDNEGQIVDDNENKQFDQFKGFEV